MINPGAGAMLLLIAATAIAQPLPVEQFFRRPQYRAMELSPDGQKLAVIVPAKGRDNLAVIDLEKRTSKLITGYAETDVLRFLWVNDRRLVIAVGDAQEASGTARFRGWLALDSDGSEQHLIAGRLGTRLTARPSLVGGIRVLGRGHGSTDEIVIEARASSSGPLDILLFDTRAGGRSSLAGAAPPDVERWWVDRSGVARIATSHTRGVRTIWYRQTRESPWIKLDENPLHSRFTPLAFDYDGGLYVSSRKDGDKAAIYRYDVTNVRVGERIARHPDVDVDDLIFSPAKRKLVGIAYDADVPGVAWLDEEMARAQRSVDQALPGRINVVRFADANPKRALVVSYSGSSPRVYYILDVDRGKLETAGVSRPWFDGERLSERRFVSYKARDGLAIPAFLTLPRGKEAKALPLVVDIHGGPWVPKQSGGFDVRAQFFASRGYAVLQPDFRGTTGWGWRHYSSSFQQWGLAMQDDITDGVEWLVGDGTVDGAKVCLFGGSYGGYATLWGLIKTPDRYRCGVAFAAVTDPGMLFERTWSDVGSANLEWLGFDAKARIGDPEKDRERLRAVSPLHNAEKLAVPVLLAYGEDDQVVPLRHGTEFRAALDRHSKRYEWVVYPDEGHGFQADRNRFDFYRRVETFLKQHLE